MEITESKCEAPLKDVLEHVVRRLILYLNIRTEVETEIIVYFKWGFDGTNVQSYKQKFSNDSNTDNQVLSTSCSPLKVVEKDSGRVLWFNENSASTRLCTCFRLQFIKESNEVIQLEKEYVENQINALDIFKIDNFKVSCQVDLSMIDGKVIILGD